MLSPRADLGIAQAVFYAPIVPCALYLLFHRRQSPKFVWYLMTMFSLVRLAGGVVNVVFEDGHQSTGLFVAALILLTVGTVPLIVSTFFLAHMILRHSSQPADRLLGARLSTAFRVVFIVDIALIVAGASQTTTAQNYTTAEALIKAGYVVLGCIVLFLIVFTAYLWSMRGRVNSKYEKYLIGSTLALPFLVVRVVYSFLSIFDNGGDLFYESKWSYLDGSLAAYIVMGLVMEYVVVCIYISVGMMARPPKENDLNLQALSSG